MTEDELFDAVASAADDEGVELPKGAARELVGLAFREVARAIERGEAVDVPGLGTFAPEHRPGREGIHPDDDGEAIAIPPTVEVEFEPDEALVERLREDDG